MKPFKKGLWLLFLVSLCGCDSPAERLFKEQVQILNDAAERMEKGTYDAVFAAGLNARTMTNLKKQEKLKIPPEERKRLEEKYKPEMDRAQARWASAKEKMTGKPVRERPLLR